MKVWAWSLDELDCDVKRKEKRGRDVKFRYGQVERASEDKGENGSKTGGKKMRDSKC